VRRGCRRSPRGSGSARLGPHVTAGFPVLPGDHRELDVTPVRVEGWRGGGGLEGDPGEEDDLPPGAGGGGRTRRCYPEGMRSVLARVPHELLEERRRLGLDRWDEVWEGVLHMVPPPHGDHGRLNDDLGFFFKLHWEQEGLGLTYPETGVRRPDAPSQPELGEGVPSDYRTPDRSFLLPPRYGAYREGWIVGGPDVVLEVVSPRDESRAKLPFYFALGVREVVLIDRSTHEVEVLRAGPTGFEPVPASEDGWIECRTLRTRLRRVVDEEGTRLHLRRTDDPAREHWISG